MLYYIETGTPFKPKNPFSQLYLMIPTSLKLNILSPYGKHLIFPIFLVEIKLKWLFGLAKPFNLYVLQVKDSAGLFLTAISHFSQQLVPKPGELNQAIPTISSRLWIQLQEHQTVHSCCSASDRATIHRYYPSFHKNSAHVPQGGWPFTPAREKIIQQHME